MEQGTCNVCHSLLISSGFISLSGNTEYIQQRFAGKCKSLSSKGGEFSATLKSKSTFYFTGFLFYFRLSLGQRPFKKMKKAAPIFLLKLLIIHVFIIMSIFTQGSNNICLNCCWFRKTKNLCLTHATLYAACYK